MSVNQMRRSVNDILIHNRNGSHSTKRARRKVLYRICWELWQGGYKLTHPQGLERKHINYLNQSWVDKGLSPATIKNNNAYLRWLYKKMHKSHLVPARNEVLGIPNRDYAINKSKAYELSDIDFTKLKDQRMVVALHLQRYFGLRCEEVIAFRPQAADQGDHIIINRSAALITKHRNIPIHSPEARHWLDQAKQLAVNPLDVLITVDDDHKYAVKNYYTRQARKIGIRRAHGLRHAYAQELYKNLTGWDAPCRGGLSRAQLSPEQFKVDQEARQVVIKEMGKKRLWDATVFLGN